MNTKVAFIINSRRKINSSTKKTFVLVKNEKELSCEFFYTKNHKHATFLARDCANNGFDCIIAVGGDGTINEVVNGMKLGKRKLGVHLGIIPNGSGNDFQLNLGKFIPSEFVQKIVNRQFKTIDLIHLTTKNSSRHSINIAGVGFDGYVIHTLQKIRQNLLFDGKLAYILSILKTFLIFKKTNVKVVGDDFEYSGKLFMMAVCNGTTFGHGITINPHAVISDGKLNITLLGDVSFISYVRNLKKLRKGEISNHKEVHYFETKKISISMNNKRLFIEADGEIVDSGDVSFEILKGDLSLIN